MAASLRSKPSTLPSSYPPRVGVELFDHIRLTAEYKCTFDVSSSYFALNLGIAFGGGKVKRLLSSE